MTKVVSGLSRKLLIDKARIQSIIREQNRLSDFVPVPSATPEKAQALMRDQGIRPEDNLFSAGIIASRNEE